MSHKGSMEFKNKGIAQDIYIYIYIRTYSEGPRLWKMKPPRIERIERIDTFMPAYIRDKYAHKETALDIVEV